MKHAASPIGVADTKRGVLVSLPPRFWLMVSLHRAVPRVRPAEAAWTYVAPTEALRRIGQWVAEVELQLRAESRRRAWSVTDAEWEGLAGAAGAAPRPAAPAVIVMPPGPQTSKGTLALLARLAAGEVLVVTPAPTGCGRFYVLRPSDVAVRPVVFERALHEQLIAPGNDGLFGPETSQTFTLPIPLPEEPRHG